MEFYKLYKDWVNYFGGIGTGVCINELNADVEHNPQWRSEVLNHQTTLCGNNDVMVTVLVRWVGLKETPFKEVDDE